MGVLTAIFVVVLLILLAIAGFIIIGEMGGKMKVSSTRNDNLLVTEKSTTTCGFGGCETQTKQCPFWNRDC